MSNKWNQLRHSRDARAHLPLIGHPEIEGDDTPDVGKTVALLRHKDALAAKTNAKQAEREATRWYEDQERREALFGERPVAATCVLATRKLAVYQTVYSPVAVNVTYRKHRHAHVQH